MRKRAFSFGSLVVALAIFACESYLKYLASIKPKRVRKRVYLTKSCVARCSGSSINKIHKFIIVLAISSLNFVHF